MNFVVQFQNKRVGSTFLQKAFNTHPQLAGIDECFVNVCRKAKYRKSGFIPYVRPENPYKTPKEYIKMVCNKNPNKITIMKIMYNQIDHHKGLREFIVKRKFPIIHLTRKNLVKQVISGINAGKQNHEKININAKVLFARVKEADNLNKKWKSFFLNNNHDYIQLCYENIIGEKIDERGTFLDVKTIEKLTEFLKINTYDMWADTKKKNKDNISVYLHDINQVRRIFKGTHYEWMVN